MYVKEMFHLRDETLEQIHDMVPEFGYDGFGELVFYRTYSRTRYDGKQESWNDVVIRVISGVMSIRKDWYLKNGIEWNEDWWQNYAREMAVSLFQMHWMPPGRGLWAMGTQFVYERGSMSLYNCAATYLEGKTLASDIGWLMDALMLGVGVGFEPTRDAIQVKNPDSSYLYIIEDTKEAWVRSVELLIEAFINPIAKMPRFDYSPIRGPGLPIKGFGGLSSGPQPLKDLHVRITQFFKRYMNNPTYDIVMLKADIANAVGCCVVAGNVRRSAEIALGSIEDSVFMDLKDYEKYPERSEWGWMSNNSVKLTKSEHFEMLGEVAKRVPVRGEPGIANVMNFPYGRIGKKNKGIRPDKATLLNPCGEITLENKEVCNLSITCPTRCPTIEAWYNGCQYATLYSSTVSLLPTHQSATNAVIGRNRRIGVDIVDGALWIESAGLHKVTKYLRQGYKVVRATNKWANGEAGVPESIKVTTIKPGGSAPKLAGCVGGIGYPTFNHTFRRIRVAANSPIVRVLEKAGVPKETCVHDPNTLIYGLATYQRGTPATRVSLWQQAMNLVTFQREWSDNAVSNTLYFRPKWVLQIVIKDSKALRELKTIQKDIREAMADLMDHLGPFQEREVVGKKYKYSWTQGEMRYYTYDPNHEENAVGEVTAHIAPLIKSCSFLPHTPVGVYPQMPEEELKGEYRPGNYVFDWSLLTGSEGQDERYCEGPACEVRIGG